MNKSVKFVMPHNRHFFGNVYMLRNLFRHHANGANECGVYVLQIDIPKKNDKHSKELKQKKKNFVAFLNVNVDSGQCAFRPVDFYKFHLIHVISTHNHISGFMQS